MDAVELRVLPASGQQFIMRADLDDACAVEDHDEVGQAHHAEAVRHEQRDAASGGGVHCGRFLSEDQIAGIMAA
jgi:hypothetical protein